MGKVKKIIVGLLSVLGLVGLVWLVKKEQDTRQFASDSFVMPVVNNASSYIPLDVKYVNLLYPGGRTDFAPFQAVHPDVVYVPEGWNGYKYWMSVSPFPNQDAKYEDPHVWASSDGYSWVAPGKNPVVPLVDPNDCEYSDADLIFVNGTMYMYYRLNNKNNTPAYDNDETTVYRISSTDGVSWSQPEKTSLQNILPSGDLASPAVLFENGNWYMFYVNTIARKIVRMASSDGVNWANSRDIFSMATAWHLNVVKIGDLYMLIVNEGTADGSKIFIYTSGDMTNWTNRGVLLSPSVSGWDSTRLYRASVVVEGEKFRLWYSAYEGGLGRTGYTEGVYLGSNDLPVCKSWTDFYINNCNDWLKFSQNSVDCETSNTGVVLQIKGLNQPTEMKFINVLPSLDCASLNGDEFDWSQTESFKK